MPTVPSLPLQEATRLFACLQILDTYAKNPQTLAIKSRVVNVLGFVDLHVLLQIFNPVVKLNQPQIAHKCLGVAKFNKWASK